MDGEVDGGELLLEDGEHWSWKGAVGDNAVDEGLVEGGAEEGAVAIEVCEPERWRRGMGEMEKSKEARLGSIPEDVVGGGRIKD